MARTQQEIEEKEFSSTAGGGVIEAVVNGKKEVVKIKIDEDVVDPEDTEMLEDLVAFFVLFSSYYSYFRRLGIRLLPFFTPLFFNY